MTSRATSPALYGGLLALLSALLFGLSAPLIQRVGHGVGPFTTAALLYGGAALVSVLLRRGEWREARLRLADLRVLVLMALTGAVLGPVALAWGLQRTSGASASLMLTLEAVFTAVLAWRWYGESMDRRVLAALLLLLAGAVLLVLEQGLGGQARALGLAAVAMATVAWGLDNTLSRALADRDPAQVVLAKSALGATATALLALLAGEHPPGWPAAMALLVIGATGYGGSLRLYLLAQRALGVARTGSVFAFAPFIGALGALVMGERSSGVGLWAAGALMLTGVILHLSESHEHEHRHEAMAHEHAHTHDDGHHVHVHEPVPSGPHSHWHRHPALHHRHPHAPDTHHTHRH